MEAHIMNILNLRNFLTLTFVLGASLAHSETKVTKEESQTATKLNQNIASLIKEEAQKLAELKEQKRKLSIDLADRKSIQNPDANFQLETVKLERSLSELSEKIQKSEAILKQLQTSSSTLAVCQKESKSALDAAKEIRPIIEKRLAALDKKEVERKLAKNKAESEALRGLKNTAKIERDRSTKALQDFLAKGRVAKLASSVFTSLQNDKRIVFSVLSTDEVNDSDNKASELRKQYLMLSLLKNPSLLDDVDQSLKNAGRATNNTLGAHAFHPDFLKAVAPEGVFPKVQLETFPTGGSIARVSPQAAAYLKSKTNFSGLFGISLKEKFSDTLTRAIDVAANLEIEAAVKAEKEKRKFKNETEEFAFRAYIRQAISGSLEKEIDIAEDLLVEIRQLDSLAKAFDKKMSDDLNALNVEHTALVVKSNEIARLERFLARLGESTKTCANVEVASLELIDSIISKDTPVAEGSKRLSQVASQGHASIQEIGKISRNADVRELVEEARREEARRIEAEAKAKKLKEKAKGQE